MKKDWQPALLVANPMSRKQESIPACLELTCGCHYANLFRLRTTFMQDPVGTTSGCRFGKMCVEFVYGIECDLFAMLARTDTTTSVQP